jgi:hypothetical protein
MAPRKSRQKKQPPLSVRVTSGSDHEQQPVDRSRRVPSERYSPTIDRKLRAKTLAQTGAFSLKEREPDGPHYLALVHFLKHYVRTEHERAVWERYFEFSRPRPDSAEILEEEAQRAGLSIREYVARETLKTLHAFIVAKNIPPPQNTGTETDIKLTKATLRLAARPSSNSSVPPFVRRW